MITFIPTVHNTVHATARVTAKEAEGTLRSIAAQSRRHGASGPSLRRSVRPISGGYVRIQVAYPTV